jgi:hypothetical protein
MPVMIR